MRGRGLWFICPVCRVHCNQKITCPSCDAEMIHVDGYHDRPHQEAMWDIPAPPRPIEWRVEWRRKPEKPEIGVWAAVPNPWNSFDRNPLYTTSCETIAKNCLRRLQARNKILGTKEYRVRVSLWTHHGDISLAMPPSHWTTPVLPLKPDPEPAPDDLSVGAVGVPAVPDEVPDQTPIGSKFV